MAHRKISLPFISTNEDPITYQRLFQKEDSIYELAVDPYSTHAKQFLSENNVSYIYLSSLNFENALIESRRNASALADSIGAKRLLLDSITHFNRVTADPIQCRSLLLQFTHNIGKILTANTNPSQNHHPKA
jgi:hypothetical protein